MPSVVLGERYELRDRIGSGGMATVWRGFDKQLGRQVAIKVLSQAMVGDERFRRRFEREARHIAALNHPNIVVVHDFGVDGDSIFIVMEMIKGKTLRHLLTESGQLSPSFVTDLAIDVLAALGHAHGAGILHRDIKPGNILVSEAGVPKLADFGIAKGTEETVDLTDGGTILGTISYASPEQLAGRSLSPCSDLYSLGCVLYECLAGSPPFASDNIAVLIAQQQFTTPESLQKVAPKTPSQLNYAVMRALEKDPANRFESAAEMKRALGIPGSAVQHHPALIHETDAESRTLTVTVLFCDVVGSTALQSAIGDDAADDIRRKLFAVLCSLVEGNCGETVKTLGDGVMAVFSDSAVDALRCAVEMIRAAPSVADGLTVRVGVSHGEVTSEGGDWFGTPVVEAARLESAAEPGTVFAAQVVRTIVGSRGAFVFDERPPLHLKGLPGPVKAFRVREPDPVPTSAEGPQPEVHARRPLFGGRRLVTRLQRLPRGAGFVAALTLVLLAASLITVALTESQPSSPAVSVTDTAVGYTPKYESISCPAGSGGVGVTCGDLIVPQDRSQPRGRQVRLLVARAPAEISHPSTDPVLYLGGVDGVVGTGTTLAGRLYSNYIGLTLRGSPGSSPELSCPEEGTAQVASLALPPLSQQGIAEQVMALASCRARLVAAGIDPNDYGADAMAEDVRDLLQVLHVKQVNLTSEAYGSLVALDVMRHYPQIVRSAALEDPYPPNLDTDFFDIENLSAALKRYAALCAANQACHASYPDIIGQYQRDYEQFQQHPVTENISLQPGSPPVPVLVDGQSAAEALETALEGVGALPTIASELYASEPAVAATGIVYGVPNDEVWSTSVYCKDVLPAASAYSQLENQDEGVDFPQYGGANFSAQFDLASCNAWKVQPDDVSDFTPLVSSVPTFFYMGALDPWLSPSWIEQMASDLTHSVAVVFPTLTAGIDLTQSGPPCLTNLERQFFDHPTAHLDVTECEAQSPPIDFAGS